MRRIFLILTITLFSVTLIAFAQDTPADDAILILTLGDASCSLVVDMPDAEVTPEPDATSDEPEIPVLTLGEDCEALIPDLLVASNGTLWIALDIPDSEGRADWQTFTSAEESAPLQFDGRGRYVGCANRDAGEQVCALCGTMAKPPIALRFPSLWVRLISRLWWWMMLYPMMKRSQVNGAHVVVVIAVALRPTNA
jgi:hypothetical protein